MTPSQNTTPPFYCPRCGGLMHKPVGSSFYWHATSEHPPCTITNIADVSKTAPDTSKPNDDKLKKQRKTKSHHL